MSTPKTVFDAFAVTTRRVPDAPFLCVPADPMRSYHAEGREFTYRSVFDEAILRRDAYASAGYGVGDRIALMLENRPEFFPHFLALNSLGASIVPLNPDYRHDELVYQLGHSDVSLVVSIEKRIDDLRSAAASVPNKELVVVSSTGEIPPISSPRPGIFSSPDRATSDRECAMLYTSGTTGRPKGCVLTNEYFLNAGTWYLNLGGVASLDADGERVFNPLPLYHMNALAVTASAMLLSGGCLISPDRFHPTTWWDDVRSTRATVIHYLGVIPPLLLNLEPRPDDTEHSVKFGFGAGVDPKHHADFEARFGFPLIEVWGMTETGRVFADSFPPRQVGTRAFGRPTRGFEARVVDEHDQDVSVGTPGELLIRCGAAHPRRGFFSGYYKDVEETEHVWRGGWFHTGDTVRQDESGMLFFVDRKKNIIRRSGENIAAAEIEAVLQSHEAVAQAAAMAVPDELREEEVFACIVLTVDSDDADDEARIVAELFQWCLEHLAYYKVPGWWLLVDCLPTTGTQKVQKSEIFPEGSDPRSAKGCRDMRHLKSRRR